ncbi:MAG TPA: hypothetical protein VHL78_05955 [Actinomycetota bacterium]|nr:hypothetical protein [Actinomycetota bacterium]
MEGIINPLAVRDPWRCNACGHEWLDYDALEDEPASARSCPRCSSEDVRAIRG